MMMEEEAELCFPQLNTSCWKTKRPRSHTLLFYTVLSWIFLLTVTLNLLVIVSISHFRQLRTPTNFLLLSLAVSDFFVGLVMLFQIMLINGCWLLGDHMCTLYFALDYISSCTSIGIMLLISVDRYLAICDPLHYTTKVTPKRVHVCVLLCWIYSLIYVSIVMNDDFKQPGRFKSCDGECVLNNNLIHQFTDFIFIFLIPITVTMVLYVRVFVVAMAQARAMRSHIAAAPHLRSVTVTARKSEIKAARTLGVVILVFVLCICPYFCVTVTGQNAVVSAYSASFVLCLYYFNSCLNPLVYALFHPWFRKSIKLILTLQILKPGSCEANMLH
ncbi:trace amine-associated receptor 13c-like [Betta splendens]|uniref:Trace amine-associated receptor 13c-like n=1 Tax=Betta splendens TaxID=158456 RepID=A0A6P7LHR9_BETSP|nr:trace amine-associated receptor 13c-like [Betta splendens]